MRVEDFPKSHRAILVTKITTVIRLVCFHKSLAIFDTLPCDTCLVFLVQKWNSRKDSCLLFFCDAPQRCAMWSSNTVLTLPSSPSRTTTSVSTHMELCCGDGCVLALAVLRAVGGCSLAAGSGKMSLLWVLHS